MFVAPIISSSHVTKSFLPHPRPQAIDGASQRLTMVSGSVDFTGISVNAVKETLVYSSVIPVPEPSALVLIALAAPLLLFARKGPSRKSAPDI